MPDDYGRPEPPWVFCVHAQQSRRATRPADVKQSTANGLAQKSRVSAMNFQAFSCLNLRRSNYPWFLVFESFLHGKQAAIRSLARIGDNTPTGHAEQSYESNDGPENIVLHGRFVLPCAHGASQPARGRVQSTAGAATRHPTTCRPDVLRVLCRRRAHWHNCRPWATPKEAGEQTVLSARGLGGYRRLAQDRQGAGG